MSGSGASVGRKGPFLDATGLFSAAGAQREELLALPGGCWAFPGLHHPGTGSWRRRPQPQAVDTWLFSSVHWVNEGLGVAMALAET